MPIPPRDRSRLRRTPRDAAEEDKSSYAAEYVTLHSLTTPPAELLCLCRALVPTIDNSASRFDDLAAEKIRRQAEGFAYYQGGPMMGQQPEMFAPPPPEFHPAGPPMFMPFGQPPMVDVRALSPPHMRALSPPRDQLRALASLSPPHMRPVSGLDLQRLAQVTACSHCDPQLLNRCGRRSSNG